jgi:hypothetical protein
MPSHIHACRNLPVQILGLLHSFAFRNFPQAPRNELPLTLTPEAKAEMPLIQSFWPVPFSEVIAQGFTHTAPSLGKLLGNFCPKFPEISRDFRKTFLLTL